MPVERLRSLLAGDDDLRDVVFRAFMRRDAIGRHLSADLLILAAADDPRIAPIQEWADSHGVTASVDAPAGAEPEVLAFLGLSAEDLPVVVMPDGTVLCAPDIDELDATQLAGSNGEHRDG